MGRRGRFYQIILELAGVFVLATYILTIGHRKGYRPCGFSGWLYISRALSKFGILLTPPPLAQTPTSGGFFFMRIFTCAIRIGSFFRTIEEFIARELRMW